MTKVANIVVIGGGHNGLTCASLLAKQGHKVTLLEAREQLGGMASRTPKFADCSAPLATFVTQMDAEVVSELELTRHGLSYDPAPLTTVALQADGQHLSINGTTLSGAAAAEQERLHSLQRLLGVGADVLTKQYRNPPPKLSTQLLADKLALAKIGLDVRRMGRDDMRDFLRVIGISIYDLCNEYLEDERLKAVFAFDAVLGSGVGPRSPGTVLSAMHRLTGEKQGQHVVKGGSLQIVQALTNAAKAQGVSIRTQAQVTRIGVEGGRVTGVELTDGETVAADYVVSGIDLKATVACLVGCEKFESGFVRRVTNMRCRGVTAQCSLLLDQLPKFTALDPESLRQRLVIAPSMDAVERAFNPVKYQQCSAEFVMQFGIEPTASGDQEVLSATVQYLPYEHERGWSDALKQQVVEQLITQLERYAPALRDHVVASALLTPMDLEREFGVTGGHWHHGELALDQFYFVRPVVGAAQYKLPINGLWMCGAGAHPGGGISGLPGRNAAHALQRALKKSGGKVSAVDKRLTNHE